MSRAQSCSLAACALCWLAAVPMRAHAYSYASPLAPGCHEMITLEALARVRARLDVVDRRAPSDADRAWIEDLPLVLAPEARELVAAALIVGVRDNDLKGHHGLDSAELARVHGNPDAQDEHCLRAPEDDEPNGTPRALAACRRYIVERTASALQGLDAVGKPDADRRLEVEVYLAFAGARRVALPRTYLELGRALHALQDSFAHAVRSEDGLRVRSVLNWTDHVQGDLVEQRDGPVHRPALDRCQHLDPLRRLRLQRAIEASTELLLAALVPDRDASQRLADTDLVLGRYLGYEPGCGPDNAYCDAPELRYAVDDVGCAVASVGAQPRARAPRWSISIVLAIMLALRVVRARRPGRTLERRAGAVVACSPAVVVVVCLVHAAPAHAQRSATDTALATSVSGAVDEAALAAGIAGEHRVSERVLLGLGAEWNPWASLELQRLRPGTLNAYAIAVYRPYVTSGIALRMTANAGASLLLFDLYGAPAGSMGPYVGLSLLALEVPLSAHARLILDPAHVAVAVPQLRGIPLSHRQYRATITLELWM